MKSSYPNKQQSGGQIKGPTRPGPAPGQPPKK